MNFNEEVIAFRKWLTKNELSTSAIALWYGLMAVNCSVGWKRKFNVPISKLQEATGLSKQGIINARKSLVENKLIRYEPGKKGCAGQYQFISLVKPVDPVVHLVDYPAYSVDSRGSTPLTIHRRRQSQDGQLNAEALVSLFESMIGLLSPLGREELLAWRERVSDEMIHAAIELGARNGAQSVGYVLRILEEWEKHGLETVSDVQRFRERRFRKVVKAVPFRRRQKEGFRSLFDELRREGS